MLQWKKKESADGNNPLETYPEWMIQGTPRPSAERRTFTTWNYIVKNQPLQPSGLLGPVTLRSFGSVAAQ